MATSLRFAAFALWFAAVAAGASWIRAYTYTPGDVNPPPQSWPAGTSLNLSESRLTVVMMLHPQCVCSRASLAELDRLMTRHPDDFAVNILMAEFDNHSQLWTDSPLHQLAKRVRNARVIQDPGCQEIRRFAGSISGETCLFARDGRLLFRGGLTLGRGHLGDSPGVDAIEQLLHATPLVNPVNCPVYGCSFGGGA